MCASLSRERADRVQLDKLHESVSNLYRLVKSQPTISKQQMVAVKVRRRSVRPRSHRPQSLYGEVVRNMGRSKTSSLRSPARTRRSSSAFLRPLTVPEPTAVTEDKIPLLHLKRKVGNEFQFSSKLTQLYLDVLKEIATAGTTFERTYDGRDDAL